MIRANTDWYSSTRDDANPIYEDEIRPREFTSTRARVAFSIFRYLCFIVLYGVLAFAALFIVLSLYGFAHFRLFQDMVSECLAENHAKAKVFAKHHVYRLAFQMTYGLSALAFCLIATRVSRFKPPVKVCLVILACLVSIVCVAGIVQEIVWPLLLTSLPDCEYDWYVIWLYRAWPWYTFNLVIFIIFLIVKRTEKTYFIRTEDEV